MELELEATNHSGTVVAGLGTYARIANEVRANVEAKGWIFYDNNVWFSGRILPDVNER